MELEPPSLEQIAIAAAKAGGAQIIPSIGHARSVGTKSTPTDVVTETDLAAEAAILSYLRNATPAAGFLAEESGATPASIAHQARLEWIVDPLDGTVNFLYGLGPVSVSVCAAVDGIIVAGAVLDTSNGQVFSATRGHGARCDGQPISVSGCDDVSQTLLATGYAYDSARRARHARLVADLLAHVRDVRCFGSSALNLCWIAAGRMDAYLERHTKPWDWSAGVLIAEEAGATIEMPCAENNDLVMATAPKVFEPLRHLVLTGSRIPGAL